LFVLVGEAGGGVAFVLELAESSLELGYEHVGFLAVDVVSGEPEVEGVGVVESAMMSRPSTIWPTL
jgi:hypothetical protein